MAEIAYQIVRSRRRTVSVQIRADRSVVVRCPLKMPTTQVEAFVRRKQDWIWRQLAACPEHTDKLTEAELAALKQTAGKKILDSIARYAPQVGVSCNRITIRKQKTRWGSCSGKGNLNFNCLLALAPAEVLDYVVVHELCHLKELNHSPRFWEQVRRVLPDYDRSRQWLRKNGRELIARLP